MRNRDVKSGEMNSGIREIGFILEKKVRGGRTKGTELGRYENTEDEGREATGFPVLVRTGCTPSPSCGIGCYPSALKLSLYKVVFKKWVFFFSYD